MVNLTETMGLPSVWDHANGLSDDPLTLDKPFMFLLCSLVFTVFWVVYITYYNSRVVGYILTKLINRFYFQDENFKIGSFTINALSGKIMFRDVVYINYDYTLRIQDGYLIFRWWRAYVPKDVSEDLSHSDTRLSIMLNGFELHVYNRSNLYANLEKMFGLDPVIIQGFNTDAADADKAMNDVNEKKRRAQGTVRSEAAMAKTWRDLIPVIKCDICSGRVVFGNRLVPTTLSLNVEEAHLVYSTKPPASQLDYMMHFVKAKAENCKVMLAPSPNYTGMVDEPPRYMGEGFVVMSSNYLELYFYMDEPGLVPEHPVLLQLANGDIVESAPPIWGIDIKCGKGTDFSYGPWADRQRDNLYNFFYPANYKNLEVTPQPKPGDRRQMQSFDIRLSTLNEATIDILFSKNKETNAVHVNIGAGSYLEITLPWIVLQDGFTTKVTGQLLHVEATTSLQYRSLAESETLEFNVRCHYPLVWNHYQCWQVGFTGCKASANIVYSHIDFFTDLITDWSSKSRPDILHFVPYTWKISLLLKEFEIITISNQYNWIDCSSTNQENSYVAFCGDLFDLSFDLPFIEFLPNVLPLKIWIQGEAVDMSLYLPEVNTSRLLVLAMDKNMKLLPGRPRPSTNKWRKKCVRSQGWIDCWSVPIVALSIKYSYHPLPPLGPDPQADITTPEKEEILLSPMRIPRNRKQPSIRWTRDGSSKLDPSTMEADRVAVELEIGPSVMLLYGSIITNFINLKENIFGEDQAFTDMQQSSEFENNYWFGGKSKLNERQFGLQMSSLDDSSDPSKVPFDPRMYRPLEVTVSVIIHDIQAHLVKNCSDNEPPCPVILIERFGFEMDKRYKETKLQVLISPSVLISSDGESRNKAGNIFNQGHLMLSSLQIRGHAMFSDEGKNIEDDTLEYAWLLEIQLGQLTGRLTLPQLYNVIISLETFVLLVCDSENALIPPSSLKKCHHGLNTPDCPETSIITKYKCPTVEDIKYKMVRVAVDSIDVFIVDAKTALNVWMSPIRFCICNLHGARWGDGITALIPNIFLKLYNHSCMHTNSHHYHSNGSNSSYQTKVPPENENWILAGIVTLGPLLIEAATSVEQTQRNVTNVQQRFLKIHDEKTKRLWFLYPNLFGKSAQCGCVGGCSFFGSNRNGPNFLKPNTNDLQEGINVAIFKVIEVNSGEYGYGQSLLNEGKLVFHTPPYNNINICLQPTSKITLIPSPLPQCLSKSPQSAERRSFSRRFSYTSVKGQSGTINPPKVDVPYSRLVDASIPLSASKIDSDSKLNKGVLNIPQIESSISDSRLALTSSSVPDTISLGRKSTNSEKDPYLPKTVPRKSSASDSHYSLSSQMHSDDIGIPDVQRTLSITSENPSEAFFSADEDQIPSRTSSLKHSYASVDQRKHIYSLKEKKECSNSLPRYEHSEVNQFLNTINADTTSLKADSESQSVSSTSFISAISSQEDMTLVNLHMQTNKPIVDSPLLMASYMNNLPQFKCPNWLSCSLPEGSDVFSVPLFKRSEEGFLVYVGQRYNPSFEQASANGYVKLISKPDVTNLDSTPNFNSHIKCHPYPQAWWDLPNFIQDSKETSVDKASEVTLNLNEGDKAAVVVKLLSETEIVISPLVLEALQKFIESLIPVVSNIHPITVINRLRLSCVNSVQNVNVLKQNQYLPNWMPKFQHEINSQRPKDAKCKLSTIPPMNVYEESINTGIQAIVNIPKVNVILIQSSVVEDLISFSALDNIQDLTCVSYFSISVDNITAKYVCSKQMLEAIQLYYRPAFRAQIKKTFGIIKGSKSLSIIGSGSRKGGPDRGEPVYIETSQLQSEDMNITLSIEKVHTQLRRLKNDSTQLKDATITAIPCQYSKVLFKCIKVETCPKGCDKTSNSDSLKDQKMSYIMFEGGLEGVTIKITKHSQMEKLGNELEQAARESDQYPDSIKSSEESKPERPSKNKAFEDLFRKKESNSKPSTPNLGNIASQAETMKQESKPANVETPQPAVIARDPSNNSSCIIDLNTVWFNFAAPPRTPITRKIDFTRLDWNLLSTASPAINAWLNPCNRLGIKVVAFYRAYYRRVTATAASLMAAALDISQLHTPLKSRYGRHTPMAKQLRVEPSLQLCAIVLRYAVHADAAALQADLAERHLPSLSTLRQGVIVLSRQWKNILYTPLLLEHNYKTKIPKPFNVTFAIPESTEDSSAVGQECLLEHESLDENSMLLNIDMSKHGLQAPEPLSIGPSPRNHSFATVSPPSAKPENSSRTSLVFPALPFTSRKNQFHDDAVTSYGMLKEDLQTVGSNQSLHSGHGSDENVGQSKAKEDLYSWMAKQETNKEETKSYEAVPTKVPAATCSLHPLQDSFMLLDAHVIFQPMLSALGVSPQQVGQGETPSHALESLGSKLSLVAWMDTFKIDIVVSEFGKPERKKTMKPSGKGKTGHVPNIEIPPETPAFLCEKVGIDVELKRVADVTVDDLRQRQNVLYISRGQLKKHINTMLNFNVSIRCISQQVNMPLLRLLHQISNMYQNVKDAQIELRSQTKISRRQNKHTSSSVSDLHDNVASAISLDKEAQSFDARWEMLSSIHHSDPSTTQHIPPSPFPLLTSQNNLTSPFPVSSGQADQTVIQNIPQSSSQQKINAATAQRSRPQSFAQKLRSTGKTVKGRLGYSFLNEGAHTPMYTEESTITVDRGSSIIDSTIGIEGALPSISVSHDTKMTPRCWRTIYYLLDLYAAVPDVRAIKQRYSLSTELPEQQSLNQLRRRDGLGLAVMGVARIHRTRLLATLSGLKLEAEITSLQGSLTVSKPNQWSLAGHFARTMIVLLEGVAPGQQTVVRVTVGKSQTLYSCEASATTTGSCNRSGLLSIGAIRVELPQHPVALHGVMTRSSRQLSTTLQELGVTRAASRADDVAPPPERPPTPPTKPTKNQDVISPPFVLQFSIVLQSLSVTAALLPSLQAQYKMEHVRSAGITGNKAQFTIDLPHHSLSFDTKLQISEANLPAAAHVSLPGVHVTAQWSADGSECVEEGYVLTPGPFLAATADIGVFEHTLSTDLLNHLVFVQKVFMKEVNEVIQKVYRGERPVPLWNEEDESSSILNKILFTLTIRIKRIQLTATTPSNSAVRLETGAVEFQTSNRVKNVSQPSATQNNLKIFAKAQVDINLSLGQLIRNAMFEEAEPDFQHYAFFNTRIALRNAFQDEIVAGEDKEVVLIVLKRPLIYIQPIAVDKAILVWLNYKNAYEYWNEKRPNLNNDVLTATQQIFERVQLASQLSTQQSGTLFLQLTVDDMGICLPLNQPPLCSFQHPSDLKASWGAMETRGAVVVTLESTSISACSSGSLVSKGRFVGLCLRFADDFEISLDDWKPDGAGANIMNLCCVSEGTYEFCSRTLAAKHEKENAKWFLNVSWKMEGVDIHLDTNVGKQLSALGHTLTMLTGFEDEDPVKMDYESDYDEEADLSKDSQDSIVMRSSKKWSDNLPAFVFDPTVDARQRSKLIEKEMAEQAKIINDLRSLGASHSTIEYEMKRLHELEALVFKDFRRDMLQKLRRQSVRASAITKGKLGLGSNRSRSFVIPSPMPGRRSFDMDSADGFLGEVGSSGETLLMDTESPAHGLSDIVEAASWSSLDSDTLAGPSRSASVRSRGGRRPLIPRQASLPAPSDSDPWGPSVTLHGETVQLRKKTAGIEIVAAGGSIPNPGLQSKKAQEPNVDFELDVKVFINSGKCVLHTKDPTKEDERMPTRTRRSPASSRRAAAPRAPPRPPDLTVFRVPGLDVKVHYDSKTILEEGTSPQGYSSISQTSSRKQGTKKAALFAWLTLHSIPEETIISPHILDFLEQTLEPIPTKTTFASEPKESLAEDGSTAAYGQYVYASFPVEVIVYFHMRPSAFRFSCLPVSRVECLLQLPSLRIVFSSKRPSEREIEHPAMAAGGLSVTGCLADFSVYIFHPYGGKKSTVKEAQWSPLSDSERKDSLSINVEFVKFHLSRSRKLDFIPDQEQSTAVVRFSTIVDIGSASFKYDMRRLTEILAFPKAWYRRSIVRRMFLGDLSVSASHEPHSSQAQVSPVLHQRDKAKTNVETPKSREPQPRDTSAESGCAWETLVLFAFNFTNLNVHMNMGNVMGNVSWQSSDFDCWGRLSIGSTGHRNMYVGLGLASSALHARAGIVGGTIALSKINTYVHLVEEAGSTPQHEAGVTLAALELRLDYMGASVLLARVSHLAAVLRDNWTAQPNKPPIILVHGTLSWQQLQLLMSRSTTPDLIKMQLKLEEFFTQQFKSSKRMFSSLHPAYMSNSTQNDKRHKKDGPVAAEPKYYKHWQKVLNLISEMQLSTLKESLPATATVLGGTMELRGTNISLGCFHGTSFKAKSWALFSLKEPCITFSTEAQRSSDVEDKAGVSVVQSLTVWLGGRESSSGGGSLATVTKVTRNIIFPPQYKTLREWFHYAFAGSDIDAVECFPSLESGSIGRGAAGDARHTREAIFALPALQLHLRTAQLHRPLTSEDEKPVVECSFITEFEDHIFVSVDAEAFLFLHDLITSYIIEKERVMPTGVNTGRPVTPETSAAPPGASDRYEAIIHDWRNYSCVTWHLEPTVRLLSWAGKSIEPYGVDYILQKLGFSHARTTIPKWLQRGTLDPLDKLLAIVLVRIVAIVPKK